MLVWKKFQCHSKRNSTELETPLVSTSKLIHTPEGCWHVESWAHWEFVGSLDRWDKSGGIWNVSIRNARLIQDLHPQPLRMTDTKTIPHAHAGRLWSFTALHEAVSNILPTKNIPFSYIPLPIRLWYKGHLKWLPIYFLQKSVKGGGRSPYFPFVFAHNLKCWYGHHQWNPAWLEAKLTTAFT